MERSTKIYIGVGAAALVAFLLLRNKAAAQKPSGGGTTGGTTGGTKDAACPAGQKRVQLQCIKAPCGSMCMPDKIDDLWKPKEIISSHPAPPAGCKYDANWNLVCEEIYPELPTFVDDILPAPMPAPASTPYGPYGKMPYDTEYYKDNMYYQNLFQQGGGVYQKELL